jgi:two-component system, cell cycle response regulator
MWKGATMNILALENDPKDLALIQQALDGNKYTVIPVASSSEAWEYIQSGESNLVIANWDTSDMQQAGLIQRVRNSTLGQSVYILLTTSKGSDEIPSSSGMDDAIHRPFKASDLKSRLIIAERIVSLASNLAIAREQLENQAVFDNLTGFINRAALLRQSAGELERSRRASLPLSLIALDIDNFKAINDAFGNETGDEVLQIVAQTIREKSRPYDCIGRWTGDEFVIVLPGVIGADAEKIAERIIAGVHGTRIELLNGTALNVKMSAGIASIARITPSTEVEPIIQQARQAVTQAKEDGGNQVFLAYI